MCLEVQLYLTFAGFVVLAHACVRPATESVRGTAALTRAAVRCGLLAAAVSLYWPLSGQPEMPRSGWLWMYWYLFLLGVFARWCEDDRLAYLGFGLLLGGAVVAAILWADERAAAGAATSAAIRLAGATGWLRTALNWRWLQFLGAISYSLYLTHDVFGVKVLNLAVRLPSRGLWIELGVLSAVAALSLIAAYLLYRLVERPFVRLSRRLKPTASERLPA